jgi:hypothetical protein
VAHDDAPLAIDHDRLPPAELFEGLRHLRHGIGVPRGLPAYGLTLPIGTVETFMRSPQLRNGSAFSKRCR